MNKESYSNQLPNTEFPILKSLFKNKKTNIIIFATYCIVSLLIVMFIIKKQYTSTVSIIPSAASFASGGITGKLGALGDLAGINLGGATAQSQEMYMGIVNSRRLLENTIYKKFTIINEKDSLKGDFISFLEIEGENEIELIEKAIKEMREEVIYMDIDDENGILYLNVTTPYTDYSAKLANYISEKLNEIVQSEVQKEFRLQLSYLNQKVDEAKDSLAIAEENLKFFLENNTDPTIPGFQVEQLRLKRTLEVQTAIYVELRKQLEIYVLENMVNLSDIKILDHAKLSYKKSRPKRSLLLISFVFIAMFIHIGFIGGKIILTNLYEKISKS